MGITGTTSFTQKVYIRRSRFDPNPLSMHKIFCYAADEPSILDTRAWALQERLLSPKKSTFAVAVLIRIPFRCTKYFATQLMNRAYSIHGHGHYRNDFFHPKSLHSP